MGGGRCASRIETVAAEMIAPRPKTVSCRACVALFRPDPSCNLCGGTGEVSAGRRERFEHVKDEKYREYVRSLDCLLKGVKGHTCWGPTEFCHVRTKATGSGDRANGWPGCHAAHSDQHQRGIRTFEKVWKLRALEEIAATIDGVYDAEMKGIIL